MRFALMTEPQQGLSYEEILALARTAEEAGLEAFFRSDHYTSFPGEAGLPTTDAWATLAGLARETTTIRLGSLVSPVTFRIPGPFAKMVATVDEMSGGRIEVGMGAGWNEQEHAELGIRFPPLGERYAMLEEAVAIVHGLWTEPDGWRFEGRYWQLGGSRFRPRPERGGRRHPPIILGGDGGPRQARLAARYADEFNLTSATPQRAREAYARMREACVAIGREPDSLHRSAMVGVLIADSEGDLRDRIHQLEAITAAGSDADEWLAERRERWIVGTLDQAASGVQALADAGAERIMLQDFIPRDLDMVRVMGRLADAV
jgi:F420-dependent oxidoreductase-like protein